MPLALTTERVVNKKPLSNNNNNMENNQLHEEMFNNKGKAILKNSQEYQMKRERNNIAVRRSRDKAKKKAADTQQKVITLVEENKHLRGEVNKLSNEVSTLKNLLHNISQMPSVKMSWFVNTMYVFEL